MKIPIPTLEKCRSRTRNRARRVNGDFPANWEMPGMCYVGRKFLAWPDSGFGNPVKFETWFMESDKRNNLSTYIQWLDDQLNGERNPWLIAMFNDILTLAVKRDIVFGCWCLNWDGESEIVPLCHACYFARAIDWLKMRKITQVCVDERGVFWPNHTAPDGDVVVLRKPV